MTLLPTVGEGGSDSDFLVEPAGEAVMPLPAATMPSLLQNSTGRKVSQGREEEEGKGRG